MLRVVKPTKQKNTYINGYAIYHDWVLEKILKYTNVLRQNKEEKHSPNNKHSGQLTRLQFWVSLHKGQLMSMHLVYDIGLI